MKQLYTRFHISVALTAMIYLMQFVEIWWVSNRVFASCILLLSVIGFVTSVIFANLDAKKHTVHMIQQAIRQRQ